MFCSEKEDFFDDMDSMHLALTFDDVRLRTGPHTLPDPLPANLDLNTRFTENVPLKAPFVSAAMDTVTESGMAIAMAKLGGIGVIHYGLSIDRQKEEVRKVKFHMSGLIPNPVTVTPGRTLQSVMNEKDRRDLSFDTFPVIDREGRLIGVISRDSFEYTETFQRRVGRVMKNRDQLVSAPTGTTLDEAYRIMLKQKINTLPLTDPNTDSLTGLYLWKDVKRLIREEDSGYNTDDHGRLRVAAAVPTDNEALERLAEMAHYLDAVVIDSADGDSFYAFDTFRKVREAYPTLDIVAPNITEGDSAKRYAQMGANAVKVGQGGGSICSTRRETGIGIPQVTAVYDCAKAIDEFGIPVISDGGIVEHGDLGIAIAAGASSIMMGNMLAGTDEAPGKIIIKPTGARVKVYRGMGSLSALRDSSASRKRYQESGQGEPLAEGVESEVPYKGTVARTFNLCRSGLMKSMRYTKSPDIDTLRQNGRFKRITISGLRESHPHDIIFVE